MKFRTLPTILTLLMLLGFGAGNASATVILDGCPGPFPCNFNFGTADLSSVTVPIVTTNSIGDNTDRVLKNFGTLESAVFEGTISSLGTFALYETITNNSVFTPPAFGGGGVWSGYTVDFEFFDIDVATGDSIDWASVSHPGPLTVVETGFGTSNPTFSFTTTFGTPLGQGQSFDMTFVFNTDIDTTVGYRITQTPIAVTTMTPMPEPTSLALIGLGLAGLGVNRRKKA